MAMENSEMENYIKKDTLLYSDDPFAQKKDSSLHKYPDRYYDTNELNRQINDKKKDILDNRIKDLEERERLFKTKEDDFHKEAEKQRQIRMQERMRERQEYERSNQRINNLESIFNNT